MSARCRNKAAGPGGILGNSAQKMSAREIPGSERSMNFPAKRLLGKSCFWSSENMRTFSGLWVKSFVCVCVCFLHLFLFFLHLQSVSLLNWVAKFFKCWSHRSCLWLHQHTKDWFRIIFFFYGRVFFSSNLVQHLITVWWWILQHRWSIHQKMETNTTCFCSICIQIHCKPNLR